MPSSPEIYTRPFVGSRTQRLGALQRPEAPPWRDFERKTAESEGQGYVATEKEILAVNAALYLRRPLLITGKPGCGKSSLAAAVAYELDLGPVLLWPITSRSTLQHGLYSYDAVRRIEDAAIYREERGGKRRTAPRFEDYFQMGPLGTAFLTSTTKRPRVLLIDEIDKSDIDLPNDLLHVFETGRFEIDELRRQSHRVKKETLPIRQYDSGEVDVTHGIVECQAFPLVILTSNGEREFPPAFHRRCLRLDVGQPTQEELVKIVEQRLKIDARTDQRIQTLITEFLGLRDQQKKELATDQLLNAAYLVTKEGLPGGDEREKLKQLILRPIAES